MVRSANTSKASSEGRVRERPDRPTVVLRVWFHDHGDKTRITLHQGPFTAEFRDMTAEGWEESFQKIDAIVAGAAA